jgi:glycosyltransferase involved in cell wall biosynthesis
MHHLWRKSIFSEAFFPIAFMVWFFERIIPFFYRTQPFVVVSPSTKKELAEIGVDESRISVIYNGSEMPAVAAQFNEGSCGETAAQSSRENAPEPYFIWLSRVHRYKGIWTALEAFEKFSKSHPDVELYVVGDGPLLKKLPSWLKTHGLEGKVELTGYVSAARKYELLSSSLALLQTSYKEGWGLTVMEAAQLCKTTIASDVPGLRDSVRDGEMGILFPSGDAAASVTESSSSCSSRVSILGWV